MRFFAETSLQFGRNSTTEKSGINEHSIVSLMGPSGCGKSTVLRLISGLEKPDPGSVRFDGKQVVAPPRGLMYSFQDYDALPWLNVEQNIRLAGRIVRNTRELSKNTQATLERIGLSKDSKKYPAQLSGGMRKRLALGRCIAGKPKAILLDEPFSSLDVAAKDDLHRLVLDLSQQTKCTFVVVTHDIDEAVFLSSRIFISTSLPFRLLKVIEVPFSYPRSSETRESQEFESIYNQARSYLIR